MIQPTTAQDKGDGTQVWPFMTQSKEVNKDHCLFKKIKNEIIQKKQHDFFSSADGRV
jgi:hypothetical protein